MSPCNLEETGELFDGERELLLALRHRWRVGVAGDVEGDEVFSGSPLERGAYDLVDVAGGAFPHTSFLHVGVEIVEILGGELLELYLVYTGIR